MSLGLQDVIDENLTLANLRQIKDWEVSVHHEVFLSQDVEDMQEGIEQSTLDNVQMEDCRKMKFARKLTKLWEICSRIQG